MMKMELPSSENSYSDDDNKNLEQLLEAFGSVVSLEDIASAYCQTGRDVYKTGELLCNYRENIPYTSSGSKDELDPASFSKMSNDNLLENTNGGSTIKRRNCPVSMGSVAGVIGKGYSGVNHSSYNQHKVSKPLRLDSGKLPASEFQDELLPDNVATHETMNKDVEDFLVKMLGDGFKLDRGVIREVLGLCGYDATKSMEKLLELSAWTSNKNDDYLCTTAKKKSLEAESLPSNKVEQQRGSAGSGGNGMFSRVESGTPKIERDMHDLQKDIMNSLFSVPERIEEAPRRIIRRTTETGRGRYGRLVVEPPRDDHPIEPKTDAEPKVTKRVDENDESNGESYDALRKAHTQYLTTMREYFTSAVEAFLKGEIMLSDRLMEKGYFFKKKAQEANDKSTEKLLETSDEKGDVSLNLCDHEPREAIRSLKCHLDLLCGTGDVLHLEVLIGTNKNDTKREARRKRIIALLEKDSLKWTEVEEKGKIIVNPKQGRS